MTQLYESLTAVYECVCVCICMCGGGRSNHERNDAQWCEHSLREMAKCMCVAVHVSVQHVQSVFVGVTVYVCFCLYSV